MKLAVFAFSRRGLDTARRAAAALEWEECRLYAPARLAGEGFEAVTGPLADFAGPVFRWADGMVFVSSCGIAVRAVAPHLRDKTCDPAVLAADETGRFVVPLLSGHIGGVSAAILEGPVPLASDFPLVGALPSGVVPGEEGAVGVCISWRRRSPFARTLLLVPRAVRLGLGCRRGTGREAVAAAVRSALEENGIHPAAVKGCASIDLKRDEPGLLAFCRERGWPLTFYSAQELERAEGDFTPSEFVREVTGVDNVCERAALLGAEKLIVQKTAGHGVTVAAAVEHWEVRFG